MKIKDAIKLLQDYKNQDQEILIGWYDREDTRNSIAEVLGQPKEQINDVLINEVINIIENKCETMELDIYNIQYALDRLQIPYK
jgi:hypothetical protein